METVTENPYGVQHMLQEGGVVSWTIFVVLVIMSLGSWFIIFTKYFDQQKVLKQARELDKKFWTSNSLREGADKLEKNSAYRQIVDDGLRAASHHDGKLTDKIEEHEWISMSLQRTMNAINGKLGGGLSFLASVGSTAPFVGLLGTVVGILNALVAIGVAGQASIDKVAGPVGEALIMTAIGLVVAVPAVLGYNWLLRRNKVVGDGLNNFANDIHAFLLSGARVQSGASAQVSAVKK